jgi:hypothetical protein
MKAGFGLGEEFCKDFDGIYSEVPLKKAQTQQSSEIENSEDKKTEEKENLYSEEREPNPAYFLFTVPKLANAPYSSRGSSTISLSSISHIVESFRSDFLESIDKLTQKIRVYVQDPYSRQQAYEQVLSLLEVTTSNIRHIIFTRPVSPTYSLNNFDPQDDCIVGQEWYEDKSINWWTANQIRHDEFSDWPINPFLESHEKQESRPFGINGSSLCLNQGKMVEGDISRSLIIDDVVEQTRKMKLSLNEKSSDDRKGCNSESILNKKTLVDSNAAGLLFGNVLPATYPKTHQASENSPQSPAPSGLFIRSKKEDASSIQNKGESLFLKNGDKVERDPNLAEWIIASDNN